MKGVLLLTEESKEIIVILTFELKLLVKQGLKSCCSYSGNKIHSKNHCFSLRINNVKQLSLTMGSETTFQVVLWLYLPLISS